MTTLTVTEHFSSPLSGHVDHGNGVIRSVKLIGPISKNNRLYPTKTLKDAVSLYEGVKVNLDHLNRPHDPRSVRDRIRVIRKARYESGRGFVGDFHFNPKHPAAEQIAWDARNNPAGCGFSHDATLRVGVREGEEASRENRQR